MSCACDAAVLCDDVATPKNQRWFRDGACRIKRVLRPVPFLVERDGVAAVFIGVVVIKIEDVGTYSLVTHTTWSRTCSECNELGSTAARKLRISPLPDGGLLAVELAYARIRLEIDLERKEQTLSRVDGGRCQSDKALAPCERKEHENEHGDGGLCQLARP